MVFLNLNIKIWLLDGFIDRHDEDPINNSPGEESEICRDCWGTGLERWCPECGFDIQQHAYNLAQAEKREVI